MTREISTVEECLIGVVNFLRELEVEVRKARQRYERSLRVWRERLEFEKG